MKIDKNFAKKLAENLPQGHSHKRSNSDVPLFFEKNTTLTSAHFRNLFGIKEDSFDTIFNIATNGKGSEKYKINSVISSALLPLLVFHPLFQKGKNSLSITIDNKEIIFDKAYFEVRNRVIKLPSCVDIVLQSVDCKTLLFLESKLSEFFQVSPYKSYGIGYLDLYKMLYQKGLLPGFNEPINAGGKMLLSTASKCYIEGIKQSISHLIGLVNGPKEERDIFYTEEYLADYKEAYKGAETIIYGSILFDTSKILSESDEPYKNYVQLYQKIIGHNGAEIVKYVRQFFKEQDQHKQIIMLDTVLSYQKLFTCGNNSKIIPNKVKEFYQF